MKNSTIWRSTLPRPGHAQFSHGLKAPLRYDQVYAKLAKERKQAVFDSFALPIYIFKLILVFTDVNTYKY